MQVMFFDHNKICLVCGHAKERCTCDKTNLVPCHCNTGFNAGGWQDCPECHGRGWLDKPQTKTN